jgi:hypothetical protein
VSLHSVMCTAHHTVLLYRTNKAYSHQIPLLQVVPTATRQRYLRLVEAPKRFHPSKIHLSVYTKMTQKHASGLFLACYQIYRHADVSTHPVSIDLSVIFGRRLKSYGHRASLCSTPASAMRLLGFCWASAEVIPTSGSAGYGRTLHNSTTWPSLK